MQLLVTFLALVISTVLGLIIIPRIIIISKKKNLYDSTNVRKIHVGKVSRLGGVSFFPTMCITLCLTFSLTLWLMREDMIPKLDPVFTIKCCIEFLMVLAGLATLFLVGLADDLVGLRYKIKFFFQILSSLFIILSGVYVTNFSGLFGLYQIPAWFGILLSFLIIIFLTNAINLIDGVDGLASGLSIISLLSFGFVFYSSGLYLYAKYCAALLGTLAVFWVFNVFGNSTKGNKIFMGDSGSLTIGFVLSFCLIKYDQFVCPEGNVDYYFEYFVLAASSLLVPVFDAVRVAFHRIKYHQNQFLPDKNHIHHRLKRAGFRTMNVMLFIIALDLFFIVMNCALAYIINLTYILIIDVIVWGIIHFGLSMKIKKYEVKHKLAHDSHGNQFHVNNPAHYGTLVESNFVIAKTPEEEAALGNYEIRALEDIKAEAAEHAQKDNPADTAERAPEAKDPEVKE
jgi:UDP-GlcNAc:undecaprenyl-phosphate GlcNAc-1-phosphate transferase